LSVRRDEADVQLHDRLLAGDDDALAEAYDRWSALVHTLAVRITDDHGAAEEVTQDVFVQLWERPETYDPARGALRSWLCMLARGRAIDWIRRQRTRLRYHASAAIVIEERSAADDVEETVTWETEAKAVRSAVHALPEPQRAAVLLAYYHGRSYREVARDLDIPEGTAKSRLRVALATLAERLTADGIVER
jgi:RNA polymerase sigma-70 factor (ECF subfamily)